MLSQLWLAEVVAETTVRVFALLRLAVAADVPACSTFHDSRRQKLDAGRGCNLHAGSRGCASGQAVRKIFQQRTEVIAGRVKVPVARIAWHPPWEAFAGRLKETENDPGIDRCYMGRTKARVQQKNVFCEPE